jgi:hypothetical protein
MKAYSVWMQIWGALLFSLASISWALVLVYFGSIPAVLGIIAVYASINTVLATFICIVCWAKPRRILVANCLLFCIEYNFPITIGLAVSLCLLPIAFGIDWVASAFAFFLLIAFGYPGGRLLERSQDIEVRTALAERAETSGGVFSDEFG